MIEEPFRTLYLDPGDDTGWCLGRGDVLLAGGTEKMWPCWDDAWAALNDQEGPYFDPQFGLRDGVDPELNSGPIGRIVIEDFRLYAWKAKALKFDPLRTPKIVGAYRAIARIHGIPFVAQPAAIKPRAIAGGARELYWFPEHENRHQNDAVQHFFFFTQTELRGIKLPNDESSEQKNSFEREEDAE